MKRLFKLSGMGLGIYAHKLVEVHEVWVSSDNTIHKRVMEVSSPNISTPSWNKAETSGYPSWVQCPADENRYISEFDNSESIKIG